MYLDAEVEDEGGHEIHILRRKPTTFDCLEAKVGWKPEILENASCVSRIPLLENAVGWNPNLDSKQHCCPASLQPIRYMIPSCTTPAAPIISQTLHRSLKVRAVTNAISIITLSLFSAVCDPVEICGFRVFLSVGYSG